MNMNETNAFNKELDIKQEIESKDNVINMNKFKKRKKKTLEINELDDISDIVTVVNWLYG